MARLVPFVECCLMGFNDKYLTRAISFKVQRGYQNITRRLRFNNKWYSRSKHNSVQKLLEEVNGCNKASISDESNYLDKVSVIMGYESIQDLIEQEVTKKGSGLDLTRLVEEFDFVMACERFPSIILGNSDMIELYNDNTQKERMKILLGESRENYQRSSNHEKSVDFKENCDEWQLIGSTLSDVNFLPDKENLDKPCDSAQPKNVSNKQKLDEASIGDPSILDKPIKCLPGIYSRHSRQLENGGFHTVRKLLHHFPRTYADLQNGKGAVGDGQYLILVGTVISSRGIRAGSSFSFLEVIVTCEFDEDEQASEDMNAYDVSAYRKKIYLHLKKFFRGTRFTYKPFLQNLQSKYNEGDRVYVSGKVKKMREEGHYEMREYTIDILEEEEEVNAHIERKPYPLYPSKAGLKPGFLRDIISRVLKLVPANIDPMPNDILRDFNLFNLRDAYFGIHCPRNINEADSARRRLIFDEFFYLQLARLFQMVEALGTWGEKEGLLEKYRNQRTNAVAVEEWSDLTKKFLKALPYSITPSQMNAVSEIIWDLKRPVPMNRLLQGDVGCGKTVVAFLACMEVIASGFQAAFMVPTELLAIQHYEHFLSYLESIGEDQPKPSVALLTGSTLSKQSRAIRQGLQTGDIAMVIGTHSLIAEKIEFSALRIAVIDEQHRFGVIQRGRFNSKLYTASASLHPPSLEEPSTDKAQMAPHVLAMSATPIPRTLALALYGDMSLTQITDLLPGRVSVKTYTFEGNESGFEKVYQMMLHELTGGGKVYLVYPVIEESEQLPQLRAAAAELESISAKFEGYQCGLLHGRMKSEEKDEALRKFRSGHTRILLATQVIEIGIDVPDASMMVVMNAERFGIAQLHQLRGRVGRGDRKSICIFMSSTAGAVDRLKVLEKSSDGFYLANVDLLFRGPGNLLGKKQSGHLPEFPIARLEIDGNMLQEAHLAALEVLSLSSDLEKFPRLKVELSMRQPLCLLGD